ncbi:MAG: cytochrome c3 family protein [Anaerosomatales bacterium]|nr:cytochrome c3 family protein [Anaerosomatales bacterium]
MRNPLSGFADPLRRPRYLVWSGVGVIVLLTVMMASLAGTSTRWFCNEVCHVVHYDNARQYEASTHSRISCLACHIPVNLDGLRFTAEKAEKLPDVWHVLSDSFHLPMNEASRIALTMPEGQCTQCHNLATREPTPTDGILIDHAVHSEAEIPCAICHNRVAHPEIFDLTLPGNEKHEDFMTMTACFRCHTLTDSSPGEFTAPGACSACHTPGFELMPGSHREDGFYTEYGDSSGHARMAAAEESTTAAAGEFWAEAGPKIREKRPMLLSRILRIPHGELTDLPPAGVVNECSTCHVMSVFCEGCHGVEMPHPASFTAEHAALGDADPEMCARCHNKTGDAALNDTACDQCHHPAGDPRVAWISEHDEAARATDDIRTDCYRCHEELFCSVCHVRGEKATRY